MANKEKVVKPIVRSVEAQAVIDVLKKNKGKDMTLAEISAEAGMDLKTGHLSSGRASNLIATSGEREVVETVSVKKSVKTYTYTGE